jgi:hypothetical protein
MNLSNKLMMQGGNPDKIYLFKEGMFYKVYNEGAFLLKELKYKVSTKQLAKTKQWYLSIGFPESVLENLKEKYTVNSLETEGVQRLNALYNFEIVTFEAWKEALINTQVATINSVTNKLNDLNVLEEIKNYPLANKTPMEVFIWVSGLQLKI